MSDLPTTTDNALTPRVGFLKGQRVKYGEAARPYRAVASELAPSGLNVRGWHTPERILAVAEMAKSIFANCEFEGDPLTDGRLLKSGVDHPIKAVNTGELPAPLDSGETRWRAVRLLEGYNVLTNESVPPKVRPDLITFDVFWIDRKVTLTDRRFGVALANQQTPFTDLEWAAYFNLLFQGNEATGEKPVPQRIIAERLGKEESWVSHIHKINKLPAQLLTMLERGQITTTTAIDVFEAHGAEGAVEHLMAEIEAGKSQAAIDYQSALEEAKAAQAALDAVIASGSGNDPVSSSPRSPTKFAAAQRVVQSATGKIERAKRQMKHGPDRITGRQVKERAAGKPSNTRATTGSNGKINRTVFAAMHDAVIYAAKHSQEPFIRAEMNAALLRAGYPEVKFEGRDSEQPPLATLVMTGPEIVGINDTPVEPVVETPAEPEQADEAAA